MFLSCNDSNLTSKIESIFDLEVSKSIKYVSKKEEWNEFNGDGYRIVNYIVEDGYNWEIQLSMKTKGAVYRSRDYFVCSELENVIISDSVLYLAKEKLGESHILLYDSTQKTFVYLYEIH
jgi:hypothetical protein